MSNVLESLLEMGFSSERVQFAMKTTGSENVETLMDWLLSHEDAVIPQPASIEPNTTNEIPIPDNPLPEGHQPSPEKENETPTLKFYKCNICNKLFEKDVEIQVHGVKTGHDSFSETTEQRKPLTDEEKKEQLATIEGILRERRLQREAKEKEEALEKERNRIRSGKEMLEAKNKFEETEMKKIVEQRKREKNEEKLARQRVKEQIEQDKMARKAKQSGIQNASPIPSINQPVAVKEQQHYDQVLLNIRLINGSSLVQSFGAKEPLSAVKLYIEMNSNDNCEPFKLMTNYPKKIFTEEDYNSPLETLGLGPRAILFVSK